MRGVPTAPNALYDSPAFGSFFSHIFQIAIGRHHNPHRRIRRTLGIELKLSDIFIRLPSHESRKDDAPLRIKSLEIMNMLCILFGRLGVALIDFDQLLG